MVLRRIVKERPPASVVRSVDRCLRAERASRLWWDKNKKARILAESGPLRTEFRGRVPMRAPRPDASGSRSARANVDWTEMPDA